jgi:hypothetical protein
MFHLDNVPNGIIIGAKWLFLKYYVHFRRVQPAFRAHCLGKKGEPISIVQVATLLQRVSSFCLLKANGVLTDPL